VCVQWVGKGSVTHTHVLGLMTQQMSMIFGQRCFFETVNSFGLRSGLRWNILRVLKMSLWWAAKWVWHYKPVDVCNGGWRPTHDKSMELETSLLQTLYLIIC